MEDYPHYKFVCSQAQQLEWMRVDYPALFKRIQAQVAAGRFIPAGGTWVEPDCNIPSGESLVRQFLFGQRFFQQQFGQICREFWNPDVFGYSAALPQIMRQAGIRYFLTQKLSWNQFNKPASHTFLWEGLDGSQVLTHFPPADTYNATVTIKEVLFNVSNFKDHERANESYMLFGYGDGGGGPTPAMLERLERIGDVDGLPRTAIRSPQEFFARCEADVKDPTVWVGELYFELHRGTYTTQARNKRDNRRSEELLHDVEFLAALSHVLHQWPYPAEALSKLWRRVLTNQFHDIIPGSSITEVYQDSAADYDDILQQAVGLRADALATLMDSPTRESASYVSVVNTIGIERTEVVTLPVGFPSSQLSADGRPLGVVSAPAYGYNIMGEAALHNPASGASATVGLTTTPEAVVLENDFVRAQFGLEGGLISLFDKRANRECIAPSQRANQFVLFDDQPNNWEAWDVDAFHLENRLAEPRAHAWRVAERGPLRASVEFDYPLSSTSRIKQTVSLTATSSRLDFINTAVWHESRKFLKVEFPLNLRASQATYEIQFGHVQRPTHFNTSWDLARFEVCGHRWADLAEPDFGVALLNDCKYGYATHGNLMRLSLLRSPKHPDPQADMGEHQFRYALLPHAGNFQQADIVAEGYRFNSPLLVLPGGTQPQTVSFFRLDKPNVVIDTIKKAEDSEALIIRLYEAFGTRVAVRLTSPLPVGAATLCNLLEEDEAPVGWDAGGVTLTFKPFQLATLKLVVRSSGG
jgi:alpha-mannosidase